MVKITLIESPCNQANTQIKRRGALLQIDEASGLRGGNTEASEQT